MTKRLQVLLDETELAAIQSAARAERVTVAEWVRGALRTARARPASAEQKLAAVRQAVRHAYPTSDIDEMLAEIEHGYDGDPAAGPRRNRTRGTR